jgi:hypothetical protein
MRPGEITGPHWIFIVVLLPDLRSQIKPDANILGNRYHSKEGLFLKRSPSKP